MPVKEAGKYSVGQSTGNKLEKTVQRRKSPIRLQGKCGNVVTQSKMADVTLGLSKSEIRFRMASFSFFTLFDA